jgi:ceramide glucosyltransferase
VLTVFHVVSGIASVASLMGVIYLLIAIVSTPRFARSRTVTPARHPSVTILKPVCGADPGLYDNLVSFCRQDYAGPLQIVIGAHRETDPAVPIARRVIADLPDRDIALIVDGALPGSNFKVCNLANMMIAAKHEVLVLADSDMRVTPDYLGAVIGPLLEPGVGLVTCLYSGTPAASKGVGGVSSALGCGQINYGFLPSVLVGRAIGVDPGCFGATIALRRDTLESVGGFSALINQLADDYMLGALVRAQGLKVALSRYVVENIVEEPDFATLYRHELRWQRTIRNITALGYAGAVITNPVPLALIALPFAGFSGPAWLLLAAAVAARLGVVYMCRFMLDLPPLALGLVPVRDALSFAIFVASFLGQRVTWRQSRFQVGRDGALTFEGDPLA